MSRALSMDALTIWTAARVMRGQLAGPQDIALAEVRADLRAVSVNHSNPNLAAIAGSAAKAHPFMHAWMRAGEVVAIR